VNYQELVRCSLALACQPARLARHFTEKRRATQPKRYIFPNRKSAAKSESMRLRDEKTPLRARWERSRKLDFFFWPGQAHYYETSLARTCTRRNAAGDLC